MKQIVHRQGDILFVQERGYERENIVQCEQVERENGRIIVALGEATGHHHAISTPDVAMHTVQGMRWIVTGDEEALITHEEHAPVKLDTNTVWRVIQQVEYTPRGLQQVLD